MAVSKLNLSLLHLCKHQLCPFLPLLSVLPAVLLKRCYISSQHPFYYAKQAKLFWLSMRNVLSTLSCPVAVPWAQLKKDVFILYHEDEIVQSIPEKCTWQYSELFCTQKSYTGSEITASLVFLCLLHTETLICSVITSETSFSSKCF